MSAPSMTAGRYRLHTRLGQGAIGVVYAAIDPDRQREVAVKVMLPDVAQDAVSREHFLRESRAISRLRHRHLATVYEAAGADEETPWLAMELLRGTTLAARLTVSPPPTLVDSLEIIDQLCVGLQCAHEHGLVHRNVTPANIWLFDDGSVKLADFGLPPTSAPTLVDPRAMVGRVAYLSPEQIATGAPVDGRADIFSAGVVLFELVTGRRPFEAESITGIFDKVINEAAPSIGNLLPRAATPLQAILQRALDKDPARRYADPFEMAAELTEVRLALLDAEAGAPDLEAATATFEDTVIRSPETRATVRSDVQTVVTRPAAVPAPIEPAPTESGRRHDVTRVDPSPELTAALAARMAAASAPYHDLDSMRAEQPLFGTTGVDTGTGTSPGGLVAWLRLQVEVLGASVRENPLVAAGAGLAVLLAVVMGAWLMSRTPTTPVTERPRTSRGTTPPVPTAEVRIESEPADAELFLNGAALGLRTPATLPVDRLRGAEVRATKEGFDPATVRVAETDLTQRRLVLRLAPEAPPVVITASAPFAFEVVSGRTVLSRAATSHRFTVRSDQPVRVRAPEYFLDRPLTIAPGRTQMAFSVPALGRLSVRTTPSLERCRVSIAGRDFGSPPYPPIQYQPIVAGVHRVQLTCEDGSTRQESVTVEAARDRSVTFR
jgi:eukaryotic-like serine/threonine-protein kinase